MRLVRLHYALEVGALQGKPVLDICIPKLVTPASNIGGAFLGILT
jgi:hypothetical protein